MILKKEQISIKLRQNNKKEKKEENIKTGKCIRKEKDCLNCKVLAGPKEQL